jgi:16S rRNA processing protein RimM
MVLLGVIAGAHGIKGEVRLRSFAAEPGAIAAYGPLVTSTGETIEIDRLRRQKDGFIAVLKGVTERNRAETLKGTQLFVPRARLPAAEADEVYVHDIVDLIARLKDGSVLGKVVAVLNFGAGDLLEVKVEGRKETVLIPFADAFVAELDTAQGLIVIDLPDGYLDEV